MKLRLVLFYTGLLVVSGKRNGNRNRHRQKSQACYDPANRASYVGQMSETINGHTCQKWNVNDPHSIGNKPKPSKADHNYCRNPDNDPNGPWCYTTNRNERYDYCHVPHCNDRGGKQKIPGETCLPNDDLMGQNFKGTHRFAKIDGKSSMCQSWNAVLPHRSMFLKSETHNYCRNPDNDPNGPWCYVHNAKKKGSCIDIPLCEGRRAKSGACGVPAIKPTFTKALEPTPLRVRRDTEHVDNAGERYDQDYYTYESEVVDESVERHKTFVRTLQNSTGVATSSRIVGGLEVKPHSIPWQVSIRYRAERLAFCGGSIITDSWVITAAHCMMDEPTHTRDGTGCYKAVSNLEIYAGTHSKSGKSSKDSNKQVRPVRRFCMHPRWNEQEIYGDAALMQVKQNFVINNNVLPICLPQPDVIVPKGTMCMITGFGRTQRTANENVMNQQTTPVVSNIQCNRYLGAGTVPDNSQMCAGFEDGGVDTCQGDSGGPLACMHGEEWVLDGITSWGYGCGDPRSPGVYTRVSNHIILSWVKQKTGLE